MKKFFLLSLVLMSQIYSMELTRRRHQTPTPVTMNQQTQTPIDEKEDAWDKCKRDMTLGVAACLGGAAARHLCVYAIAPAIDTMDMGASGLSMISDLACVGHAFVPPICCCALSLCLCKKALKGVYFDHSTPQIYIENGDARNPVLDAVLTAAVIKNMSN